MIITRKWLNKYIDFEDVDNKEIVKALNSLGFEVDRTHDYNQNSNVVAGRIQVVNKIVDTKLQFCLVDTRNELVDPIVCGASNPTENGYVVVAQPGAKLANGMEIKERKIKDYVSEGMMCSFSELGISEKYLTPTEKDEIILTFNEKDIFYEMIGSSEILNRIGLTDYLFEVDLTLNRSDCLSAYELARELARYFDRELYPLKVETAKSIKEYQNPLKISLDSSAVQSAISVNVKINDNISDLKLSNRVWLKLNEYMSDVNDPFGDLAIQSTIETGQPLLIYDYRKIKSALKITDNYENKEFKIVKGDLVVIDGDEFVELIGIKTNPKYLVTKTTKEITILALHIDHIIMRQQQRKVGISNINLQRYIKPLSYATVGLGLSRYLYLLEEHEMLKELSVFNFMKEYKKTVEAISITIKDINNLIGRDFSLNEIKKLLEPLNFQIIEKNNELAITPPITRTDIFLKADLVEEVARLFGYDNILPQPPVLPNIAKTTRGQAKIIQNFENFLINNGFYQAKTYTLVNKEENQKFNFFNYPKAYKLLLPLSQEHEVIRLSLTNSLLESLKYNNARNNKNVKLFTVEKIYPDNGESYYHSAFVAQEEIIKSNILHDTIKNSFYYMKSLLEAFINSEQIDINALSYKNAPENSVYHPFQTSQIFLGGKLLGIIGVIHPLFLKEHNLKPTYFCEINFSVIFDYSNKIPIFFTDLNKFTSSSRDISFWLANNLEYETIKMKMIEKVEELTAIEIIDQYFDEKTMPDHRALTISFTFNSINKQLTETEINFEFNKIKNNLEALNLKIR